MHLSCIEVTNFRSLKALKVGLRPGLNVLVGRNNTGKTNLLQAIRHALGPSASRGDALWLERDDFFKETPKDETPRTISITLTFADLSDNQRSKFFEIVDFDLQDPSKSKAYIRFEASWPEGKRQASIKRTGGPLGAELPEIPAELLASLPITYLPALRDAEACLAPGHRSRLAALLRDLAERRGSTTKTEIELIYTTANRELEAKPLIKLTVDSLQATTKTLAGSDYSASAITAAEVEFEKILRTLQVQMDGAPIGALDANGLGYNNLLYMAVVLEHLKEPQPEENPLFLIEEPEAHLHPQLTMLLADYLASNTPGGSTPQTIVTTHSPTMAATVPPKRVHVLFSDPETRAVKCNSVGLAGMDEREERQLQRMMDITRATLYFAKGIILVEGISEALLMPVLAKRLGHDFGQKHISVIPICGVAFEIFKKLLNPNVLGVPVTILTDSDPEIDGDASWNKAVPKSENGKLIRSDRALSLETLFREHATVRVHCSTITLEYDLAEAGDGNAAVMAEVWESCFQAVPRTFNRTLLAAAGAERQSKALATWRGICRATHTGSKADFAHRLADHLSVQVGGLWACEFEVPTYLKQAINDMVSRAGSPITASGAPSDGRADATPTSGS